KGLAWWLTGSVGLLSDALESFVNLAAAIVALWLLKVAARPPDDEHSFGHDKAEYFASGIEGIFILAAATGIALTAVPRFLHPEPLQQVGWGLAVSAVAALVNLVVGQILIRAGKAHHSITLEADGQHLMMDVWTSAGVIAAVALVAATDWLRLDPLIAIAVAAHICLTGVRLMRRSVSGLMDSALPREERDRVQAILERHRAAGVDYHALRTRQAGHRRFVYFHLLVPGAWSVEKGHNLMEDIEGEIRASLPYATVIAHLEPVEDPSSYQDVNLDR
ncbi:MAG: cation transporter, partial [Burkholderiales bacterium]|nr:cation transporter [Burkholderiales bacterium]